MTKKIGVSLPEDLYDWAAGQVREGRAESVSALIAEGLALLEARALLTKVVDDLRADLGELDDERRSRVEEALRAAEEAQRRRRAGSAEHAA